TACSSPAWPSAPATSSLASLSFSACWWTWLPAAAASPASPRPDPKRGSRAFDKILRRNHVMKKLFALVLCLMLALGCTAAFAEGETHTVYLITMDLFDAHWVGVDEGCQAAVAELAEQGININYVWNAPTQGKDDAAQIECI